MLNAQEKRIHDGLLRACSQYHSSSEAIVVTLLDVARLKLFHKFGRKNLVEYIVEELKIDSTFTFDLNRVVRAAIEFPELEHAFKVSSLTVGKATRILGSLTKVNAGQLIAYASNHTFNEINAHVAQLNPQVNCRENWKQLSADQFKVTLILNAEDFSRLQRTQSLEAQKQKNFKMSAAVGVTLQTHLSKCDPREKAARAQARRDKRRSHSVTNPGSEESTARLPPDQINSEPKSLGELELRSLSDLSSNPESVSATEAPNKEPLQDRSMASAEFETINTDSSMEGLSPEIVRTISFPLKRKRFTAAEKHQVVSKSGDLCMFVDAKGIRCTCDRWLDIHHLVPVSEGGSNAIENLVHLCGPHHDLIHQLSFPLGEDSPKRSIWDGEVKTARHG